MKTLFIKIFVYFALFSLLISCFNYVYSNAYDKINTEKVVYLTFDDGPSKNTSKILDILKINDVHATFFVICPYIESHNALIKRAYDEGNAIGNHTHNHEFKYIYLSEEAFWNNFNKHQNFLKEITGKDCTIFRFPGGSHNTLVRNAHGSSFTENIILKLNEQGINCYDSKDKDGHLKSPAIVLMHDCMTKTTTVEALPKIIEYFKEQGYKFDTLN